LAEILLRKQAIKRCYISTSPNYQTGWQASWWPDSSPLAKGQARDMGHHSGQYACSVYLHASGHFAAGAAELAVSRKEAKYSCLPRVSFFVPIALETLGGNSSLLFGFSLWGGSAVECRYKRCARDGILVL